MSSVFILRGAWLHGYGAVEVSCSTSAMMNGGVGFSFLWEDQKVSASDGLKQEKRVSDKPGKIDSVDV